MRAPRKLSFGGGVGLRFIYIKAKATSLQMGLIENPIEFLHRAETKIGENVLFLSFSL